MLVVVAVVVVEEETVAEVGTVVGAVTLVGADALEDDEDRSAEPQPASATTGSAATATSAIDPRISNSKATRSSVENARTSPDDRDDRGARIGSSTATNRGFPALARCPALS